MRIFVSSILVATLTFSLAACGDKAKQTVEEGMGAQPKLPAPHATLIPTIDIAPAKGWAGDARPVAAQGLAVAAFAKGLDHPRWLYVLPNGDVLVAETNTPPQPGEAGGIKGWVAGMVLKRAGAAAPTANRITLLRDTDGDGVAETRTVFLENLYSPFGMALVGNDFYVANANAILRFPYKTGETKISETRRQGR